MRCPGNLTDEKRSYLRGKQYEHRKKAWGAEKGGRGNQHTGVVSAHYEHLPNSDESRSLLRGREYERQKEAAKTADTIAKEHGVGQATIRRDVLAKDAGAAADDPRVMQAVIRFRKEDPDGWSRLMQKIESARLEEV